MGSRLDHRPELLFVLRGVDAEELISSEIALPTGAAVAAGDALAEGGLSEIFGIDIATEDVAGAIGPGSAPGTVLAPQVAAKRRGRRAAPPETRPPTEKKTRKTRAGKKREPVFDPDAPTGAGIARLRKLTGLSMEDFARELGVSLASVCRWEGIPGPLRLYARPLAALTRVQEEATGAKGKRSNPSAARARRS